MNIKLKTLIVVVLVLTFISCSSTESNENKIASNKGDEKNIVEQAEQNQHIATKQNVCTMFVTGLNAATVYPKLQAIEGATYRYFCGVEFVVFMQAENGKVNFYMRDQQNNETNLNVEFGVGYKYVNDECEIADKARFVVGQYDFDGDKQDELLIAIQDYSESLSNGISINIFTLQKGKWIKIADLTGRSIMKEPMADVEDAQITIQRFDRNLFYQWTFKNGTFTDTGEYR